MKFPSIKSVASVLSDSKSCLGKGEEVDVRLQVLPTGAWHVHVGDSQYDQDHNGFWGSCILDRTSNLREEAIELLKQCREDASREEDVLAEQDS